MRISLTTSDAGDAHRDHAAAGGRLDLGRRELLLRARHVGLHLLDLLEHLLHVAAAASASLLVGVAELLGVELVHQPRDQLVLAERRAAPARLALAQLVGERQRVAGHGRAPPR